MRVLTLTMTLAATMMLPGCMSTNELISSSSPSADEVSHHLLYAENRLDVLSLLGAKHCLPASIEMTQEKLRFAQTSFKAELLLDAANALVVVDQHLQQIDNRLGYLKRHTPCAQDPVNQVQLLDRLAVLLNSNNQFASGKSELTVSFKQSLRDAAMLLQQIPYVHLELTGHTDFIGSDKDNMTLSQARAEAVKSYLVAQQIQPNRLSVKHQGEQQPLASNQTTTGQLANRRVNIDLVVNQYQTASKTLPLKHWWRTLSPTKP